MPKKTYIFGRYLELFEDDAKVYESETGVGTINLYRRAANKKEIILQFLIRKYGDDFQFRPDFFAGLSRIEFSRRPPPPKKAAAPKPKAPSKTTATTPKLTATQKKRLAATGRITIKRDGKFVTITR